MCFSLDMAISRGTAPTGARPQLLLAANLVVKPTDEYHGVTRFPRSSLWAKKELDLLGVHIQQTPLLDLNKIIR